MVVGMEYFIKREEKFIPKQTFLDIREVTQGKSR